ncbi:unnamed protein product, partial [Musa banksii]
CGHLNTPGYQRPCRALQEVAAGVAFGEVAPRRVQLRRVLLHLAQHPLKSSTPQGSSSGPAAVYPNSSSASSSSIRNSGWLTHSVRTTNRSLSGPTYTEKQPSGGICRFWSPFLWLPSDRHRSSVFSIRPFPIGRSF